MPWSRHNVKVSVATEWLMLVNVRVECTELYNEHKYLEFAPLQVKVKGQFSLYASL